MGPRAKKENLWCLGYNGEKQIGPIRQVSAEQALEQLGIGIRKVEKEGQWERISNIRDKDMCNKDEAWDIPS